MLIIFDWDGTLSNSTGKIVECMHQASSSVGLPVLSDDAVKNIIGLGLPDAIRVLYPDIDRDGVEAMRQAYSSHFLDHQQLVPDFYEGAEETVELLLERGHLLAVATGKSRKGLDRVLSDSGWHRYFHASRCADETASKPDPLMLQQLLAELDHSPDRAVMVGDTEYDLAMAQQIGMPRVAVGYGAHHTTRLEAYSPALVTHDLRDLLTWVDAQS